MAGERAGKAARQHTGRQDAGQRTPGQGAVDQRVTGQRAAGEAAGRGPGPASGRAARQSPGQPSRRADAEHNRERIIETARAALTRSSDATLNSIAKQAGVGQGTLYRHFPTREALLVAVYHADLRDLLDCAPGLLDRHPADEALRHWLDRLAGYGRIKHGAAQAVRAATRADLSAEYYAETVQVIGTLLSAGQRSGALRADVDAQDVLLLVGFLWRVPNEDWERRTAHLLDLVMDGLRAGH
ncbi:TetR/AcrR family transcriptional regulator [Kineosporia sp. J2-2]|uniref:TetR/AcrR family transcriptional regulator n=1 Tax=Kineosporia corallincola TaxID=2835133 RepID=A0ABS5TRP5_9ACTN|nr:TetR/AcrR family transcriptional regulator [Kineosporia corallincola]MBT0773471.1 TetR/AcrR family transcriptional regulator [Kineosporia corallincola]